jgi:hypothetical protein
MATFENCLVLVVCVIAVLFSNLSAKVQKSEEKTK